jgi:hypothetical protein
MRRALIAFLMAATAATPLAAQDWHGRNHENSEQRSQRAEQRSEARQQRQESRQVQQQQQQQQQQVQQPQRFERQQAENRGNRDGRSFQQQQVQIQQQAVQAQQQQQIRAERFQGRGGGNWNGNRQDNANRFAAEREASRRSAEQTIGGSFARQAAENERRYEQQTLRREQRDNRNDGRGWNGNRNDNRRWDGNRNDGRRWEGNRNGGHDWNRNWRNDNRYDWQRYRYQNRRIFSPGRYYAPYRGYGYNRLNIGIVLDQLFFGRDYWIDPYDYHLPPAAPGTEWVRYYNDVVLVDTYSGEVLDVIYDFFL